MKVCVKTTQLAKGIDITPWHAIVQEYELRDIPFYRTGCGMVVRPPEVVVQEMAEPRRGLVCSKRGCRKHFPEFF